MGTHLAAELNISAERIGTFGHSQFAYVISQRLLKPLHSKEIPADILEVLTSWLSARKAKIAVGNQFSRNIVIRDMVYQGIVLGPPLLIILFKDAAMVILFH